MKSILLMMAHQGEAQAFNASTLSHTHLILTGTGVNKARDGLKFALTKFPQTTEIINLGYAGSLSPFYAIGSIHPIKEVSYQDFPSKLIAHDGLSLLSLDNPLHSPLSKKNIEVIDQELWGLALVAEEFNIPLRSFKLISDHPFTGVFNKDEFKRNIPIFSKKLFDYYEKNIINQIGKGL